MKKIKMEKGITLIALLITVVVLLILAVVAINSITNDGLLGKAESAANKYNQSVSNEQDMLDKLENTLVNFKKEKLQAPIINITANTLSITDVSGKANDFDLYVDGEYYKTISNYMYENHLSELNLSGSIWRFNDSVDFSQFTSSIVPYIYRTSPSTTHYINIYAYKGTYECGFYVTFSGYSGKYAGLGFNSDGLHFNYGAGTGYSGSLNPTDLGDAIIEIKSNIDNDETIGLDNLELVEWFESNAQRVSTIFDLSTLNLSEGSHTITVKAQNTEYKTSDESNLINYNNIVITDLTNTTWRISRNSFKYCAFRISFSGNVSYGDYLLERTAQSTQTSTNSTTMYFSNTDALFSDWLYPRFRVWRNGCQVCPSENGSYINIPYFDVYIDGDSTRRRE